MKKILSVFLALFIAVSVFSVTKFCQKKLWDSYYVNYFYTLQKKPGFVPKANNLRPVIIGFDNFVADLYWLRAVQFAGSNAKRADFDSLYEYLDLVTDLDQNFLYPFHFGALLLPLSNQVDQAINLLEKEDKRKNEHTNWQIIWDLAFIKFFYQEEYEDAANLYDRCSQIQDCLPGAKKTAANLRAKMGKYEIALERWQSIFENPETTAGERELAVKKIEEAEKLIMINNLAKRFERENSRPINNIDELKKAYPDISSELYISPYEETNPFIWDETSGRFKTRFW